MTNSAKLPSKPATNSTSATLTDGKTTYSFLYDPETLNWAYQSDYATTSVLLSQAQDVTWKYSTQSLSFPKVLFMSQGMHKDVSDAIDQLSKWCLEGVTLQFAFGATAIARCHISKFTPTQRQWRAGKVTYAEASLDFLISREPVKVEIKDEPIAKEPKFPTAKPEDVRPAMATKDPQASTTTKKTFTDRELLNIKNVVTKDMTNPAKRRAIKLVITKPYVYVIQGDGDATVVLKDAKGERLYADTYSNYKAATK